MFFRFWMFVGLSLWVWTCQADTTVESKLASEASTTTQGKESSAETEKDVEKTVEKKSIESAQNAPNEEAPNLKDIGEMKSNNLETTEKDSSEKLGEKSESPKDSTEAPAEISKELAVENKSCVISNQTQFSWLVKIVDKETKKQVCTGTLITDEDILVPASCFLEDAKEDVPENFYEIGRKLLAIAGGGVNHNCMQIRNVSVVYPHKGYFEKTEEHDYAFLKVTPEFDVDDEDIPDLRYHLNVINSEGGLVNIHNNGPFCESPYFLDEDMNSVVAEERHLLGMRIDDCMMKWNCSADFDTCLSYLHPAHYACLKPLTPRNCSSRDRGAPLVCEDVFLGYLHMCNGELPMIFRGLNKAIKFLELEDDHIQEPGYMGRRY